MFLVRVSTQQLHFNAFIWPNGYHEAAWRVVDPVLHDPLPVAFYEPGTWGPPGADKVIEGDDTWHNPTAETSAPC